MDKTEHESVEARARRLYRQATGELDSAARAELARARVRAVEAAAGRDGRRWMLPAAAAAAAGAIVLGVMMTVHDQADFSPIAAQDPADEDMELLLATENLDMLSDLDFYLWLDTEPDAG